MKDFHITDIHTNNCAYWITISKNKSAINEQTSTKTQWQGRKITQIEIENRKSKGYKEQYQVEQHYEDICKKN